LSTFSIFALTLGAGRFCPVTSPTDSWIVGHFRGSCQQRTLNGKRGFEHRGGIVVELGKDKNLGDTAKLKIFEKIVGIGLQWEL
jgi:hypothetical protein